jgi:hypothetical protein
MSNDARINQYRSAIETKRKELGDKPKLAYTTNALLDLEGGKINLNTLNSEKDCVEVAKILISAVDLTERANKVLGTNVTPKFGDFTVDQWLADLQLRVKFLSWEERKKKLAAMDTQLKTLMSDDAKTADAIAAIAAQLGD